MRFYDFNIADFNVRIIFKDTHINGIKLLKSFNPFAVELQDERDYLFKLIVDDSIKIISKGESRTFRTIDDGNGDIRIDILNNGGYQYIIKDVNGRECCLLQTNKDFSNCKCALNGSESMRMWGLNIALMLIFAFAGSFRQTILIHASLVRRRGLGFPFIAKSGTGKSTHVSMWIKYIEGCDIMNDDNPIIRIVDDTPYIYGSPWSGKTPCYRNVKAKLGAITRIDRATENCMERLQPVVAFNSTLASCSSMKWDEAIYRNICSIITKLVESVKIYTLHCLPDKNAAVLCNMELCK